MKIQLSKAIPSLIVSASFGMSLAAVALGSNLANAETKKVYAGDYTCEELQTMVKNEGKVYIEHVFGGDVYLSDSDMCSTSGRNEPIGGYVPSKDTLFCLAGWVCKRLY